MGGRSAGRCGRGDGSIVSWRAARFCWAGGWGGGGLGGSRQEIDLACGAGSWKTMGAGKWQAA